MGTKNSSPDSILKPKNQAARWRQCATVTIQVRSRWFHEASTSDQHAAAGVGFFFGVGDLFLSKLLEGEGVFFQTKKRWSWLLQNLGYIKKKATKKIGESSMGLEAHHLPTNDKLNTFFWLSRWIFYKTKPSSLFLFDMKKISKKSRSR